MEEFSDLLKIENGHLLLQPGIHDMESLLSMEPEEILDRFRKAQIQDFTEHLERDDSLYRLFPAEEISPTGSLPYLRRKALLDLFHELHDHVMSHPVWLHPFFIRIFRGDFQIDHAKSFSLQYFNQIKNTRQCVSLSLGRFYGGMPRFHGQHTERISEMAQIVLSQLLADEYGVATEHIDQYPQLRQIFQSTTHIVMYRQLFEGLQIPQGEQDVPMSHGVADNVLIQRILAGNERFTPLESLASVGLGMEWGVPEFFTLLLGGLIRFAYNSGIALNRHHLFVFIAHVRYDVMHAIAVMFATAMYIQSREDIDRVRGAVNTLMAGRYDMMSDLYTHVFQEECPRFNQTNPEARYTLSDKRVEEELLRNRAMVAQSTVLDLEGYRSRTDHPFVY